MVFELKSIYKDYMQGKEAVPVLKDITMSVDEGEYVAIMGPSGSGKSTLMNIIGCLDKQTKGDFIFDGMDIMGCNDKELSEIRNGKIGFVFQNFNLLPRQSALENVELPLLYAGVSKKERRERAIAALKRVGLEDRMQFKPTQLSGGQKQRVAIARAIVNQPRLLLADEPTGALDTKSGDQVMELFKDLNNEGVTIVMITHEPDIAKCAKRVMFIRDGQLHTGAFNTRESAAQAAPEEHSAPAGQTAQAEAEQQAEETAAAFAADIVEAAAAQKAVPDADGIVEVTDAELTAVSAEELLAENGAAPSQEEASEA